MLTSRPPHTSAARRLGPIAAAATLLPALAIGAAGPAAAHSELLSTTPASGSTVGAAPTAVSLRFSDDLIEGQGIQNILRVTDAAGNQWQDGSAAVAGPEITVPLCADLPQGDYTAAYRVVYADGHSAESSFAFTVDDPAAPAAGTAPTGCGTPAPGAAASTTASASQSAVGGATPSTAQASTAAASSADAAPSSAAATDAASPAAEGQAREAGQQDDAGVPAWVWLAGLVGVVALVAGAAVVGRRISDR